METTTEPEVRRAIRSCEVIDAVCQETGLCESDILGDGNPHDVRLAKRVAAICLRDICQMSFPEVGKRMGGRQHSTIVTRYHRTRDAETLELIAKVYTRLGIERKVGDE